MSTACWGSASSKLELITGPRETWPVMLQEPLGLNAVWLQTVDGDQPGLSGEAPSHHTAEPTWFFKPCLPRPPTLSETLLFQQEYQWRLYNEF